MYKHLDDVYSWSRVPTTKAPNIGPPLKQWWLHSIWHYIHILGKSWLTLGGRPSDRVDTDDWLLILADWALRIADCTADCTADWAAVCWVVAWERCPLVSDWELWEEELDVVLWDRDSWFRTCKGKPTWLVQKNSHVLFQVYGLLNQKTSSVMNYERSIYSLFYAQSLILPITITCCFRLRDS